MMNRVVAQPTVQDLAAQVAGKGSQVVEATFTKSGPLGLKLAQRSGGSALGATIGRITPVTQAGDHTQLEAGMIFLAMRYSGRTVHVAKLPYSKVVQEVKASARPVTIFFVRPGASDNGAGGLIGSKSRCSGMVSCQFRGKGKFRDGWLSIEPHPGVTTFRVGGAAGKVLRTADIAGCMVATPQAVRKEHEIAIKVTLMSKDSEGDTKWVIAVKTMDD